jgi:SAM-dependent methyltransferase
MIEGIIRQDRRLRISHAEILKQASAPDRALVERIDQYIDVFCGLRGLSEQVFLREYQAFIARYTDDMKRFKETGRYPLEDPEADVPAPDRVAYDAALLLSVLVSGHRFQIFKALDQLSFPLGRTAIIGAGPGLELHLLSGRAGAIDVYDLTIDQAMARHHATARFHRAAFERGAGRFDTILAIELLEHVHEPYRLLEDCHDALEPGGRVVATTATNIPQFDHVFNFTSDDEFEARASRIGFEIESKEPVIHAATFLDIGARNTFYVLRKTGPVNRTSG